MRSGLNLTQHHHEILPSAVSPSAAADSPVHHQRRKTRFSQPEAEISQTELSKETLSTSSLQSAIPLRFHNYVAILMMPAENQRAAMDGK
ncbi:hypothetical protein ROHU_021444 [Labeo rohita]|uniref:Uncharacterized protein n=1 Tax=Labeo rohita TaxID=84645 RepID=A0A498MUE0_LABRO|nr:hypothetical protein ROHU_021444 [Labeo rohita]